MSGTAMQAPVIEAGIVMPPRGTKEKHPFNRLAVGESFFESAADELSLRRLQWTLTACGRSRKRKLFTTRIVRDGTTLGVRVWRTA